ncbi:MAG: ATP-binding protein [Candidatus Hodarchaeales archaeon]
MHKNQESRWSQENVLTFKDHWKAVTIPINITLDHRQTSLPLDQVLSLIHSSEKIAVGDCLCRSDLQNCDLPRKVCFSLNKTAIKNVDAGKNEFISKGEAEKIVLDAHQKGLLHLALYRPDEDETNIEAICSCCPCCCSALHGLLRMNLQDLLKPSPYLSTHDPRKCTNCGECTSHCYFHARNLSEDETMTFSSTYCFGCGLCVTRCPEDAISMDKRVLS